MTEHNSTSSLGWLTRRRALLLGAGAAAGAFAGLAPRPAAAALRLDITQGNVQPIPIALPDFVATGEAETAHDVTRIIASNLQRSGLFLPIDPAAYIERNPAFDYPRFPDWRQINAQALVTGRLSPDAGRLKAEFRLWDVFAGQQLASQSLSTSPENWRRIAHIISDLIYARLTGDMGYFDSRIVFVDEFGSQGAAGETSRHHGPGRRPGPLPHPRR